MEFEILETQRLILKKITPEIFTYIFENYSDAGIKKLLGLTTDAELLLERQKSQGGYKTYNRSIVAFVLVLKETDETIGRCGFHNWYQDHRKAEVGYHLHHDKDKRKGYMSEALTAILDYGFGIMDLNRIEACIGPANIASQTLIKKFGFIKEGYLRQHFMRDGEIHDTLIFGLLREDI